MDRTFVGDICFVRVRKTDLLEQESVRISPDFVCVDTPFWMDHGTCCEHSSCISVGERRASVSPYGFKKKRIIQQYLQLNTPTALIKGYYQTIHGNINIGCSLYCLIVVGVIPTSLCVSCLDYILALHLHCHAEKMLKQMYETLLTSVEA